jgi:hypothetical protein
MQALMRDCQLRCGCDSRALRGLRCSLMGAAYGGKTMCYSGLEMPGAHHHFEQLLVHRHTYSADAYLQVSSIKLVTSRCVTLRC